MTGYIGLMNVTNSNTKFDFVKSITIKDGFIQIIIPPGAYEIENLNKEIKRNNIEGGYFTEADCPFTIKPNFSTLGSVIEVSSQEPVFTFVPDVSIRELLGFNASTIFKEYNLSPNPVDNLSFDIIFLETDIA